MTNALITLDDGKTVELPTAQHEGAHKLFQRAERLHPYLPSHVNPHQFLMAVVAEANNPALAVCDSGSVVAAAFNAARVGLMPGGLLGHCHFVPIAHHRGKPNEWTECQLWFGYKGYTALAYESGFLKDTQCDVVFDGEVFRRWNDEGGARLLHEIPLARSGDWGKVQAAYCIWHNQVDGGGIAVVPRDELLTLARKGNVWKSHPIAMAKKTAVIRSSAAWKLEGRLALAYSLNALTEAGKPQPAPAGIESDEPAPTLEDFTQKDEPPAEEPPTTTGDSTPTRPADF